MAKKNYVKEILEEAEERVRGEKLTLKDKMLILLEEFRDGTTPFASSEFWDYREASRQIYDELEGMIYKLKIK